MSEEHLDFLPLAPGLLIFGCLSDAPCHILSVLMNTAGDLANGEVRTTLQKTNKHGNGCRLG